MSDIKTKTNQQIVMSSLYVSRALYTKHARKILNGYRPRWKPCNPINDLCTVTHHVVTEPNKPSTTHAHMTACSTVSIGQQMLPGPPHHRPSPAQTSSSLRMLSLSFRAFQAWSFSFLVGERFFWRAAMMRRKASITSLSDTRTRCLSSCFRISSLASLRPKRRGEEQFKPAQTKSNQLAQGKVQRNI